MGRCESIGGRTEATTVATQRGAGARCPDRRGRGGRAGATRTDLVLTLSVVNVETAQRQELTTGHAQRILLAKICAASSSGAGRSVIGALQTPSPLPSLQRPRWEGIPWQIPLAPIARQNVFSTGARRSVIGALKTPSLRPSPQRPRSEGIPWQIPLAPTARQSVFSRGGGMTERNF